jgi:shikimate dehydrogenase
MRKFGLIGKSLKHSFSSEYFNSLFEKECILDTEYNLYELSDISEITKLLDSDKDIMGFNVTIPFKEAIIPYLHYADDIVKETGACNCVKIIDGKLYGYNTDVYGFMLSILPLIEPQHHKALILGNGGASKAVIYALEQMSIDFDIVARNPKGESELHWNLLKKENFKDINIIINTTPIGMYPDINDSPDLSYDKLNRFHLVYDLIYNPTKTQFLLKAEQHDVVTKNGLEMLQLQADKSWEIWNFSLNKY